MKALSALEDYGLAGEEEELANLVERLDKASTAFGMEISAEKTKLVTNNTSDINTEINVNGAWNIYKLQVPGLSYNWSEFQAWDALQESTDNSSIDKVENSLEWQKYFSQPQETTDEFYCHIHLTVCLWIMDLHSRKSETELTASVLEKKKKIQNTQKIKRTLFN